MKKIALAALALVAIAGCDWHDKVAARVAAHEKAVAEANKGAEERIIARSFESAALSSFRDKKRGATCYVAYAAGGSISLDCIPDGELKPGVL